jgi:hypothetical protein
MTTLKTKVKEVEYRCLEKMNGGADAVVNRGREDEVKQIAFRNFVEINGKRHFVRQITALRKYGILIVSIPSSVEIIGSDCFSERKSLCEVVFESNSKLKEIGD